MVSQRRKTMHHTDNFLGHTVRAGWQAHSNSTAVWAPRWDEKQVLRVAIAAQCTNCHIWPTQCTDRVISYSKTTNHLYWFISKWILYMWLKRIWIEWYITKKANLSIFLFSRWLATAKLRAASGTASATAAAATRWQLISATEAAAYSAAS